MESHAFLQGRSQFPFPHLKRLLTKHAPHPMSFSSPIAFVPHLRSMFPVLNCVTPLLNGVQAATHRRQASASRRYTSLVRPHRCIDDLAGTHHRRGRSSSLPQDPKARVMLSRIFLIHVSCLFIPLLSYLSMNQASIRSLRSSRAHPRRCSYSDSGDSTAASIASPAPPHTSQDGGRGHQQEE